MSAQEELEERQYADKIIKNLYTILNYIGKINEFTPNYDCMVDLSERITKQLKSLADPE